MVFSSIVFILYFLPVFLVIYHLVPTVKGKNIVLFIFSLGFYFWGAGKLLVLLPAVGILAWVFSWLIARTGHKKLFMVISILTFAGILIYNKYLGFIIDNLIYAGVEGLPELTGLSTLGVSFFTFQAISYNIDVYRKNQRFEKNPAYIMLYISMFPQLISGPLVRYPQLEPSLKNRKVDLQDFSEGARRFIIGLGKKVLIANQLGYLVARVVDDSMITIGPGLAWATMAVFTLQIFFDFSAYTDMALGVGRMLGFKLPENFNYPYISRSITDFWRRWHMSLAAWIKDYIFTPLAFNMRYWGKAGIVIALLITFAVCGLWHEPTWNFLLWGVVQGIFLGLEELFLLKWLKKLRIFAVLYTWFIILCCVVLFRTGNLSEALDFLGIMFSPAPENALGLVNFFSMQHVIILGVALILCVPLPRPRLLNKPRWKTISSYTGSLLLFIVFLLSLMRLVAETHHPFIYFRF